MGRPVIAFENLKEISGDKEDIGVYLCVGYNSMNRTREKIYHRLKEQELQILSFVHSSAIVMSEELGEGCLIFEQAVLGPYTKIGNANIFYPKSMVCHHSRVGNFNFFAVSSSVAGNVTINDNCFIGNNAATKDGIYIENYTLIGAGSYVSQDTHAYSCIVPARSVELQEHVSTDFL